MQNLIQWLKSIFSPSQQDNLERKKRRLLKQIERSISNSHYKFYRARNNTFLPALGKLFFDIHKVTTQTYSLLSHAKSSESLKEICIDFNLTQEQKKLLDYFSEETISQRNLSEEPTEHSKNVQLVFREFTDSIDNVQVELIEKTYEDIREFINFITLDYQYIVNQFTMNVSTSAPHFEVVQSHQCVNEIKDFIDNLMVLNVDADWNTIFDILAIYKSTEVINRREWSRIINQLRGIKQTKVLHYIIQHIEESPDWRPQIQKQKYNITRNYLNKLKQRIDKIVAAIKNTQQYALIETLCKKVFDGIPASRLNYYNDVMQEQLSSNVNCTLKYTKPINYLYVYVQDFFQKDLRALSEILLVRGKWVTNELSIQFSSFFYKVLEIIDELRKFDDSLNETSDRGMHLKRASTNQGLVSAKPHIVRSLVHSINNSAYGLLKDSLNSLISFGNLWKEITIDIDTKPHRCVMNWKELNNYSGSSMKARMSNEYRRLYHFVQLLRTFVKSMEDSNNN